MEAIERETNKGKKNNGDHLRERQRNWTERVRMTKYDII